MPASLQLPDAEQLVICRDRASGLVAAIAVDDTTLGPALGGIRMKAYPSEAEAIAECGRLARVMTLKNALADTGFGGGKAVIVESAAIVDRGAALRAFGRFVARTGVYAPAADLGTSSDDVRIVASAAPGMVVDDVDTAQATAVGVHAAIASAVRAAGVARSLDGITVAVQGVGHVGARLARLLVADGARVVVADADERRAQAVAASVAGDVVAPDAIVTTACDVLAPCALARVIDERTVECVQARVVAGAANDVLARPELAERLAERGVHYVPDFLANAGGVIQVRAHRDEWSEERLAAALREIGARTAAVLAEARAGAELPLTIAIRAAQARLARPPRPVEEISA